MPFAPPILATQKAVYALLEPALKARNPSVPLYDRAPPGAKYPYVELGDHRWEEWSTKGAKGWQGGPAIHVYSSYEGVKEAGEILETVLATLRDAAINTTADGWSTLNFGFASIEAFDDGPPDERFLHVVARQSLKSSP